MWKSPEKLDISPGCFTRWGRRFRTLLFLLGCKFTSEPGQMSYRNTIYISASVLSLRYRRILSTAILHWWSRICPTVYASSRKNSLFTWATTPTIVTCSASRAQLVAWVQTRYNKSNVKEIYRGSNQQGKKKTLRYNKLYSPLADDPTQWQTSTRFRTLVDTSYRRASWVDRIHATTHQSNIQSSSI